MDILKGLCLLALFLCPVCIRRTEGGNPIPCRTKLESCLQCWTSVHLEHRRRHCRHKWLLLNWKEDIWIKIIIIVVMIRSRVNSLSELEGECCKDIRVDVVVDMPMVLVRS